MESYLIERTGKSSNEKLRLVRSLDLLILVKYRLVV